MVNISGALSAAQVTSYYKKDYSNGAENKNYYTQNATVDGTWQGQFAKELGLTGAVQQEHYDRLAAGQNPHTGEQWIAHRDTAKVASGKEKGHRAAWDMTFGATKSVSLMALTGGDERILEAHRAAVTKALSEGEHYTQARMGGDRPAMTTGKWAVATFEHDTARPVNGPPMPHLHTHAVLFNLTEADQVRSLDPKEIFRVQQFMTAVYHSEMGAQLQTLGYALEPGKNHSLEVMGLPEEYRHAASERRREIEAAMAEQGLTGAESAQRIAHQTRAGKQLWEKDELKEAHRDLSAAHGSPEERVRLEADQRQSQGIALGPAQQPYPALLTARESLAERESVFDQSALLREALRHGQGAFTVDALKPLVAQLEASGQIQKVDHWRQNAPGERYTTPEALERERKAIETVHAGIGAVAPLRESATAENIALRNPRLNQAQREALTVVAASDDRILGLQGGAGTGKTTVLKTFREIAEEHGYEVRGLAPTGRARNSLTEAGIPAETLQRHLVKSEAHTSEATKPRYYVLDEASLASTVQVSEFFESMRQQDRALLVGDTRQHGSVEAGQIFDLLQRSGLPLAHLDQVVRQKDSPELKAVVEQMAAGKIPEAVKAMDAHGWIKEVESTKERYRAIAEDFAHSPKGTLVISPDNESRRALNLTIRAMLQEKGLIETNSTTLPVLLQRQDITKEQRKSAKYYEPGNTVRFRQEHQSLGLPANSYVKVMATNHTTNEVLARKADGTTFSYNPVRHYGVSLYTEEKRTFAVGERVQFTAADKDKRIANRDMATITALTDRGEAKLLMDGDGRRIHANLATLRHLDYGYATTSYSSQSMTIDRTLVNIETENSMTRNLVGKQLGYVAFSRPRSELRVYTDEKVGLANALNRSQEKAVAIDPKRVLEYFTAAKHRQQPVEKLQNNGVRVA